MSDADALTRRAPKVLIVDDDSAAAKFISSRCLAMGLDVQTATNGLQALIRVRQDPPDVMILDVNMPELDGLSVCSTLLEPGRKAIDIILISGYPTEETFARCESLGAKFASKGRGLWDTIRSTLDNIFPGMSVEIPEEGPSAAPELRARPVILVIDDDPDVAKFIATRLQKCGADALLASDGLQGYKIAAREKPNVIISDCAMPGADINFLMWRLRSTPSLENVPVFAITGYSFGSATVDTLRKEFFGRRGVEGIFKKPIDIDELFAAIKTRCPLAYEPWRKTRGAA